MEHTIKFTFEGESYEAPDMWIASRMTRLYNDKPAFEAHALALADYAFLAQVDARYHAQKSEAA